MLTSLIYTCVLANANPLDYLTMLQRYYNRASENPEQWMPWNYRETLQFNPRIFVPASTDLLRFAGNIYKTTLSAAISSCFVINEAAP